MSKVIDRLCAKVDTLAALNAEIAHLTATATEIKDELKAAGYDEIQGEHYKAVIVTKTTCCLDTKKVRKLLTPAQVDLCIVDRVSVSISLFDL